MEIAMAGAVKTPLIASNRHPLCIDDKSPLDDAGHNPISCLRLLQAGIAGRCSALDVRGRVKVRKKTTVSVETERILTIRRRWHETDGWCEGCGKQVKFVTPETASAVSGLSVRAICRMVETDKVHFMETSNGSLLICLNSLLRLNEESSRLSSAE
jgi:hypothetical protein